MNRVFVLHHTYGDAESETYKVLGVFSAESIATLAIQKYLKLPGFMDYPDGFTISHYVLDEMCWREGFESGLHDDLEE